MITSKIALLLIILSLCITQTIKAQSEYIVTLQNDTIRGEVKNYQEDVVKFITEGSTDRVRYKATEIKAFHVKLKKSEIDLEAMKLPNKRKTLFVNRVLSGKIILYELIETFYKYNGGISYGVTWYVKKLDQDIMEIKTSELSFNRKEMHAAYKAGLADNVNTFKEFTKIKGIRPDFVDFGTKTIYELKPYNPRQVQLGTKQLAKYKSAFEKEFGGIWSTVLDFY